MKTAISIRLDPALEKLLERFCRQTGRTRSDSEVVLRELSRVRRTRIGMPGRLVEEVEAFLREHEVAGQPAAPSALPIRGKDDRWVFASAVDGRAEVFVTGDRDLLDVAGAAPLKIVNPRGF